MKKDNKNQDKSLLVAFLYVVAAIALFYTAFTKNLGICLLLGVLFLGLAAWYYIDTRN